MNNFWEIVKFEYRKLFGRKMVWLTLGVCIAVIVAACCGSMFGDCIVDGRYYDSNYNVLKKDIENARALSGRALDDELIGEAQNAYEKVEPSDMISYMNDARPYIEIYRIVNNISNETVTNAQQFYAAREKLLTFFWRRENLTKGETEWLKAREEALSKPFIYEYSSGWHRIALMGYTVALVMAFIVGICVPPVFTEEYLQRTAQVNFCAKNGKGKLYLAKAFTAVSFSMAADLVLAAVTFVSTLLIYGTDGFDAQIQLLMPMCSLPMTVGECAVIVLGMSFFAALFYCVMAMLLAECSKNSIVPLGTIIGSILILNMISVPDNLRVLSQLYNCIPQQLASFSGMRSNKLFYLFGTYFTRQQVVPFFYLIICVAALIVCRRVYLSYQVGKSLRK